MMERDTRDISPREGPMINPTMPVPPAIHPSFIQVANPYIFEQTVQSCIESMGMSLTRENALRLQGVAWIDNVRKALNL
jgi:CTD kinase subunit beta